MEVNPRWEISPAQEEGLRAAVAAAKVGMSKDQQKEAEKIFFANCKESGDQRPDTSWATVDEHDSFQGDACQLTGENLAPTEGGLDRLTAFGPYDPMMPRAFIATKSHKEIELDTTTKAWYDKETF